MNKIIQFALSQRLFFVILAIVILGFGIKSYKNLPIDAFPDISPTQVKIIMKSSGMTPDEMESQVMIPIEMALRGIPNQTVMRSLSKYGITDVTVEFEEGTDIYWARQQVNERLNSIMGDLPTNIEGGMAPISTPLSEMLMFTIESETLNLEEKRTLLDWVIAPRIRSVAGVAEVNALGGKVKTYQVTPNIKALSSYGITLEELFETLEKNNLNDGAGRMSQGVDSVLVRSVGQIKTLNDIEKIAIKRIDEKVVTISDVAKVDYGYLTRAGYASKDGKGEVVKGIVLSLKGVNTSEVIDNVKAEMEATEATLPEGTKISLFYDRSNLINLATSTVKTALFEAVILIVIILLLMLGNVASAFSVALILPFALLMSFTAMEYFGLSANLMSLGGLAIAIGILVDSAVVMVEHITAELGNPKRHNQTKLQIIYNAAIEMAPSIIVGVLIIIIVFLPLLSLEGLEGKLFKPVALSIIFALCSSLVLALTLIPVLSSFILKKRPDVESFAMRWILKVYTPALNWAITRTKTIFVSVILLFVGSMGLMTMTGKAFMPTMDEGNTIVMIESLPSISLEESIELNKKIQKKLMNDIPEVTSIVARTGTDELGLDPMSLNDTDTFVLLKPMDEWREPSRQWINEQIRKSLDELVGIEPVFTQPIQMRVSEMLTGVRGDLAIDVFGSDNEELERIAQEIKSILETIPGNSDVYKKSNEGIEYLELEFDQNMMGYYGVNQNELALFMKTLIDGVQAGIVQEGLRRINLMVKGNSTMQTSQKELESLYYILKNGESIPLNKLVKIKTSSGPMQIEHENGYRKTVVQSNVKDRDLVGFVQEAKEKIEKEVNLPAGYYLSFGGEFENQQRVANKLMIIVPIVLFLIFILLFASFGSLLQATIVFVNVPLALIGGFAGLYFSGEYLSVPASVGFIALLGIAVLNGVVLVNYFNHLIERGLTIKDAVLEGARKRIRPVLMTALIAAFGLLPLLFASGPGSEIQKPLAIVVINGLISSTILTLFVLPLLYMKFVKEQES